MSTIQTLSDAASRARYTPNVILLGLIVFQSLTHLFWLPVSAHSGLLAIPDMLNRGMTLWGDVLEQHQPLSTLFAALALRLSPLDPTQTVRWLNLALTLLITVLVYLCAQRLSDGRAWAGVAAALWWCVWEPAYNLIALYFDNWIGFLLLVAACLWLSERRPTWRVPFGVGLLLGAALMTKQHGLAAVLLFPIGLLLFRPQRRRVDLFAYALGCAIIPALMLLWIVAQGTLNSYIEWVWTTIFITGAPGASVASNFGNILRKLMLTALPFLPFALLAIADRERRARWVPILLLTLGGLLTLVPRPIEQHFMGGLPLLAVMFGAIVGATMPNEFPAWRLWLSQSLRIPQRLIAFGIGLTLLGGLGWTAFAPYLLSGIPHATLLAYEEYTLIADWLRAHQQVGDTLFVLPETDGTPQLHTMTGLLPPTFWVKELSSYMAVPGLRDALIASWRVKPPSYVIVFSLWKDKLYIKPLIDFVVERYEVIALFPNILSHGDAQLYHLRSAGLP